MPAEILSQPTGSSDSTTLVGRLKAREQTAWQRFSDLYGPLVYSWARRAGLQDSDAADVTQDVFRAVAEGVSQYHKSRPGDSFRGWLWGIARHKILSEFRRQATRPDMSAETLAELAARVPAAPAEDLAEELAAVARRALALLRTDFQPVTWQAFEQTVLHGRAAAAVAADLDLSVGSVYTAKCRVLARLRQEMGDLL